jgi:GntR family transcriptional regulator
VPKQAVLDSTTDVPIPLYYRVKLSLRELLDARRLKPGDSIPTEAQLELTHGVSRTTVRRAINELVREGVLLTRHGLGTFVADRAELNVQCLSSFTEEALRRGQQPGTKVLDFRIVAGAHPAMEQLGLTSSDPMVFVKRLRLLDGRPILVSSAYLPRKRCPSLTRQAFAEHGIGQSLYHTLARRCGIRLGEGDEMTMAIPGDREIVGLFGLAPHSPVIQKTCLLRDRRGIAVLYQEDLWGVVHTTRVTWRELAQTSVA